MFWRLQILAGAVRVPLLAARGIRHSTSAAKVFGSDKHVYIGLELLRRCVSMLNDNRKELAYEGRLKNEWHSWVHLSPFRNCSGARCLMASNQSQIFLPGHVGVCL